MDKPVKTEELSSSKQDLVELRAELSALETDPRMKELLVPLVAAIDTRVSDEFKPVSLRDVCSITERANAFFIAKADLEQFADDKETHEHIYGQLKAITCG